MSHGSAELVSRLWLGVGRSDEGEKRRGKEEENTHQGQDDERLCRLVAAKAFDPCSRSQCNRWRTHTRPSQSSTDSRRTKVQAPSISKSRLRNHSINHQKKSKGETRTRRRHPINPKNLRLHLALSKIRNDTTNFIINQHICSPQAAVQHPLRV